jgi:hypothetical protein
MSEKTKFICSRILNQTTMNIVRNFSLILMLFFISAIAAGQPSYDESKVPDYTLPELLISNKGKKITDSKEWIKTRRPEIISLFEDNMYGKIPGKLKISSWKILEENQNALDGKAIRKQILLTFRKNNRELDVNLLVYLPKGVDKAPLFVGYNFYGNHTTVNDPAVIVPVSWSRNNEAYGVSDNTPTEKSRGKAAGRWAIHDIINAGYGLATMYYGDVDPDKQTRDGIDFTDGVHPLLYKKGQIKPGPDEWGAISAWAWGLSRAMDYFEKDDAIDHNRVIVMGHSRLGKTSLWAGALDERFAVVVSNNSGCGGAALTRRRIGETLIVMNNAFGHWLCDNCSKYDGREDELPVDQHMLIALIAPRPVYIASAEDDQWADPKGEFLSGFYATPVYELFNKQGLTSKEMPKINQPVMTSIGYHIRTGKHDVTDFDWQQYIKFADMHLKNKNK